MQGARRPSRLCGLSAHRSFAFSPTLQFHHTALHVSALNGSENMVSLLLTNGADVDARGEVNAPAEDFVSGARSPAAFFARPMPRSIKRTRRRGDSDARSPPCLPFAPPPTTLHRSPAPRLAPRQFLRTALHYAARHGHYGCACVLLEERATVDARNNVGFTPLHYRRARAARWFHPAAPGAAAAAAAMVAPALPLPPPPPPPPPPRPSLTLPSCRRRHLFPRSSSVLARGITRSLSFSWSAARTPRPATW